MAHSAIRVSSHAWPTEIEVRVSGWAAAIASLTGPLSDREIKQRIV